MQALSLPLLATRSGIPAETIERLVRLGLLTETAEGFEPDDVTRARLAVSLEQAGVPLERLAGAVAQGVLSLAFAGRLVWEPVGLTARRHGEVADALHLPREFAERALLAAGLPAADPEDPAREDDEELLALVAETRALGLPDEVILRCVRTFGTAVQRIVATMREAFRSEVEERLLAEGLPYNAMLRQSLPIRLALQRIGCRTVFLLQRRYLEEAVFSNAASRIEEAMTAAGALTAPGTRTPAIVFLDLSGFTRLTEEIGDAAAAERATRLEALAGEASRTHRGRLVKSLGDGVMLTFPEAADAVDCAIALVGETERRGLPPSRAGVAAGPVVQRDGDLFGRIVNLAARLSDYARPHEVLATEEALRACPPERAARFRRLGPTQLPGLAERLPLWSALATEAS